jgi:hypothetical protein
MRKAPISTRIPVSHRGNIAVKGEHMRAVVALALAFLPLLSAAANAETAPIYVNCSNRFAVMFPAEPESHSATYRTPSSALVPARRFLVEDGTGRFAVTVADFSNGPSVSEQIVERAAQDLRARGEVKFQASDRYDLSTPGRQLNIIERDGRQLRASVYMAEHRLFIAEASAPPGDMNALLFEQSMTLIDAAGRDLNKAVELNSNAAPRVFACR